MSDRYVVLLCLLMMGAYACKKDDPAEPEEGMPCVPAPTSPVVFDPAQVPYDSLSNYSFFQNALADLDPVYGVLPYELITPLFTDYAHKSRFIWMPDSVSAQYTADQNVLDLPNGTVLIKSFYYDNVQPNNDRRILETRLLYRINGAWQFANYVWNTAQTEATFDLNGSYTDIDWLDDNNQPRSAHYRIPSIAECLTCHKENSLPIPIGPKPQNLNKEFGYVDGVKNQLTKWTEVGYLTGGYPTTIETVVDWTDMTAPVQDRVRAYLDINCAHCHADQRHCSYRSPRFAWSESSDTTNLGVCVVPDEFPLPQLSHIVAKGNIARSVMHYRLSSTDETVRMPLLGRTIVHDEAVTLIEQWITNLTPPCN